MSHQQTGFHQENVTELLSGMTAFPEDIFVAEQSWLYKHVLPLLSIDLGLLREDLKGTVVHMINPIEPYECVIGDDTPDYHNEFVGENWIAFKLTEDNRYCFLADEGYFMFSDESMATVEDFSEHINTMLDSYQNNKESYKKTQAFVSKWDDELHKPTFLDNLGGGFWSGNWCTTCSTPSAFVLTETPYNSTKEELPNDGISITHQGKEFMFVADVAGYNWCDSGADAILMFYEPESRTVLFTFDWT